MFIHLMDRRTLLNEFGNDLNQVCDASAGAMAAADAEGAGCASAPGVRLPIQFAPETSLGWASALQLSRRIHPIISILGSVAFAGLLGDSATR